MIDPSELVDNLVSALQDIGDLVAAVNGEADRICAYHDRYPDKTSLEQAIYEMRQPGIMVVWTGSSPGSRGEFEAWKHDISIILRARPEAAYEEKYTYYSLFRSIWTGKADPDDTEEVPLRYKSIHESCDPMDTPTIRRQTDAAGIDYFEVLISFTEIGDD